MSAQSPRPKGRRKASRPTATTTAAAPARAATADGAAPLLAGCGTDAKRIAAAILEVLAGARSPSEAAAVLRVSLARYYQLELRAVAGLVAACEPRRRGRGCRGPSELASLRRECDRLQRECTRQQALVRATQRTVGLATPELDPPPAKENGHPRRRRRPTARALRMAALLQEDGSAAPTEAPAATMSQPEPKAAPN